MKSLSKVFVTLVACMVAGVSSGAMRYVDWMSSSSVSPYTNWATAAEDIQAAVNAASSGDTIRVANGFYRLSSEISVAKELTIESVNGPDATIVDAEGGSRCFSITNASVVLSGLNIRNGLTTNQYSHGAGVHADSSVTLTNCYFIGNRCEGIGSSGGAVYSTGVLTIANCIFEENFVAERDGGAVYSSGSLLIESCSFEGNFGGNYGGAVCSTDTITIVNCTFSGNSSDGSGGAVVATGEGVIDCSIFNGNSATFAHGAIFGKNRNLIIKDCTISNNSASVSGAVGYAILTNCLVTKNSATTSSGGGVMWCDATSCEISYNVAVTRGGGAYGGDLNKCIIIGNVATTTGGGLELGEIKNCLVSGNTAGGSGGGCYETMVWNSTVCDNSSGESGGGVCSGEVYNSVVCYNSATSGIANIASPGTAYNNYDGSSPLFVDRTNGNYRLQVGSPCVDAGGNAFVTTSTDLDETPRIHNSVVDIGAYEFQGTFPDDDGDGLDNFEEGKIGTNPQNPDSDGDGFDDGWEVSHDWNPTNANVVVTDYIEANTTAFGYYTSNSVGDLAMGEMMVGVSNAAVHVQLQLMQSPDLITWTNVGVPSGWSAPATNKSFFRVRAQP